MSDLNVVRAAQLARLTDRGAARRGPEQRELDLLTDGAVAIRGGRIAAVGTTDEVSRTGTTARRRSTQVGRPCSPA